MEHPGALAALIVVVDANGNSPEPVADSHQRWAWLEHAMAMKSIMPGWVKQADPGCYPLKYAVSGWSDHLSEKIIQGVL